MESTVPCRNVHIVHDRDRYQDPLLPVVPVSLPVSVLVPFPCSVKNPLVTLQIHSDLT